MSDTKDPVEFWFDFSSPYSYIASERIDELVAKHGRKVKWRPIMLGAAFKASGLPFLVNVPLKGEYSKRDFDRSARYLGVPYTFPPRFPVTTLAAARGYYWLHGQDCNKAREFAHAVFRAYWVNGRDIGELPVVLEIAGTLGIDGDAYIAAIATPEIKERLKRETDAAIAKGMFGAPYFMVDGEPFWGADRLPQIEKWLATGGF
ncbi:MAG: 2-hydroxychromene-2-carboxylate isomerase [Rhodocyclales bacterium]|jgi:2-hydroxychromene-2-carboxylate isomerase|nr:2-hydroxychromene-2-carboxylate isomerase [Rhodocyclales bacterium]